MKSKETPYNTFAGAATQEWYGPFLVPGARFDVFPLRVKRKRLRRFIDTYFDLDQINADLERPFHFEPVGRHVYMIASWGRTFSKNRSDASIEALQVGLYAPVRDRNQRGKRQIVMAVLYVFVNNPVLAMTMREVRGVPAIDARIETPPQFLQREGPLLQVKTDVLTAIDAGMPMTQQTLIEVIRASPGTPESDFNPILFAEAAARDRGPLVLNQLTLKEFGDAEKPSRACYRALVLEPWSFYKPKKIAPIRRPIAIRIYQFAGLPIVDQLGLRKTSEVFPKKSADSESEGALADILTPENPFRIETDIEIGLGEVLSHTAGPLPWMPPRAQSRGKRGGD